MKPLTHVAVALFACVLLSFSVEPKPGTMIAKKQSVPIVGKYTTSAQILNPAPMLRQQITGTGTSSHLGKSTFVAISTINLTTAPPFQLSGTATFTAANGDEFYTTFTGTATPNGDGSNTVEMEHTITGGSGRFMNASGSLTGITIGRPGHATGHITQWGEINY